MPPLPLTITDFAEDSLTVADGESVDERDWHPEEPFCTVHRDNDDDHAVVLLEADVVELRDWLDAWLAAQA